MRLLFISTETRPIVGGIGRCLDGWLSGLVELGHEVCMLGLVSEQVYAKTGGLPARSYREEWLAIRNRGTQWLDRLGLARKMWSALFIFQRNLLIRRRCVQMFDGFRPDVVIFSVLNTLCCQSFIQARRRGVHCAGIAYGSEINPVRVQNPRWLRRTLAHLDRIVVISDYTRELAQAWSVQDDRIVVVHPALSPDIVARARRQAAARVPGSASKDESGPMNLLTICRIVERKGVQTVIQAVAQLRSQSCHIRYDIVGEGPYRRRLEELAEHLGVSDVVRFHGGVSDTDREALLRDCDIFVMDPFESADGDVEGFGIVFLEAGLFGKPVIGSHSGGISDAVRDGHTGILVRPQDVPRLVDAIRSLILDQDLYSHLAGAGRRWARKHFPENCGPELQNALEGMPQSHHRSN